MRRLGRTGAALLAVSVAAVASVGADAGVAWSIAPSSNPPVAQGLFTGVSCTAASSCSAVGNFTSPAGADGSFAEQWNGTSWTVQTIPAPAGAQATYLDGVACTTSVGCTAVGYYFSSVGSQAPLVESWNGTSWTVEAAPGPSGARGSQLAGVSCPSPVECVAVGEYVNSSGTRLTLVEDWNGASWAVQSTPNPPGARSSVLSGVSCAAPMDCSAVGNYIGPQGAQSALAESWNGASWTVQAAPSPPGAHTVALVAISCPAAASCAAVGSYAKGAPAVTYTLAERWDGLAWTVRSTPNPFSAPSSALTAVSCSAVASCTAVGSYFGYQSSSPELPLADVWDGTSWTAQSPASPSGPIVVSALAAVACPASGGCTAVGMSELNKAPLVTLAESWNGSAWSIQATPDPSGAQSSQLAAIGCSSATACTAVGNSAGGSGRYVTLAERWNGSAWSVESSPNSAGAHNSYLAGVACPAATACTAVGDAETDVNDTASRTLVERWNGTSWSVVASPNPSGAYHSALAAVSCVAATWCAAVGASDGKPLAETWNGTAWVIAATLTPPGAQRASLVAVSCASGANCVAAGTYSTGAAASATLIERWDGSSWTIAPSANPSAYWSDLYGVACTSTTACTAVGDYTLTNSARTVVTLAERWNGTSWSVQTTPDPSGARGSGLASVSCPTTSACTAVGGYIDSAGEFRTLVESWNGTSWAIQPSPNPPRTNESDLNGVACTAGACDAVGYYVNGARTTYLTLAERYP